MNWFKDKFNKKDENYEETNESENEDLTAKLIPATTLARWYLYDVEVENPNEVAKLLGLYPVSQEGEDKEKEDSQSRMDALNPLLPFLANMSDLNGKIMSSVQLEYFKSNVKDLPEHMTTNLEMMAKVYAQVSFAALLSSFSAALELGLVDPGWVVSSEFVEVDIDEQF
jgi:hypothetical protein